MCFTQSDEGKAYTFYTSEMWEDKVFVIYDNIYVINVDLREYRVLSRDNFKLNENGYLYYLDDIVLLDNIYNGLFINRERNRYKGLLEFYEKINRKVEERYLKYYPTNRMLGNTTYSSSSQLIETTKNGEVLYEVDNLGKFAFDKTEQICNLYINFNHKPWVEGKLGYGIGEFIEITCDTEFASLVILNGYIDFDNLELYKKNSRIKNFIVEDLTNDKQYSVFLDDEVKFQFVYFENKTKNVRLTINDVYKGSKWDDTCLTGVIPSGYEQNDLEFNYLVQNQDKSKSINKELEELLKKSTLVE